MTFTESVRLQVAITEARQEFNSAIACKAFVWMTERTAANIGLMLALDPIVQVGMVAKEVPPPPM